MDPTDPIVAWMVERCLNNAAPDPLDIKLEDLHPQIGPLEIHVPDGYISSVTASPSPVHFLHSNFQGPQHPVHYYRQPPQPSAQQPVMHPSRSISRSGELYAPPAPFSQAAPELAGPNPPSADATCAQPSAAGASRLPPNHPVHHLSLVAKRTVSHLSKTDPKVQHVLKVLRRVLGYLARMPAGEVERAFRVWKASQDGTSNLKTV
jgi:hypothetical protein